MSTECGPSHDHHQPEGCGGGNEVECRWIEQDHGQAQDSKADQRLFPLVCPICERAEKEAVPVVDERSTKGTVEQMRSEYQRDSEWNRVYPGVISCARMLCAITKPLRAKKIATPLSPRSKTKLRATSPAAVA